MTMMVRLKKVEQTKGQSHLLLRCNQLGKRIVQVIVRARPHQIPISTRKSSSHRVAVTARTNREFLKIPSTRL